MPDKDNIDDSSPFLNEDKMRALEAIMRKMVKDLQDMAKSMGDVANASSKLRKESEAAQKATSETRKNAEQTAKSTAQTAENEQRATQIAKQKAYNDRQNNTLEQNIGLDKRLVADAESRRLEYQKQAKQYANKAASATTEEERAKYEEEYGKAANMELISSREKARAQKLLDEDRKQQREAIEARYGVGDPRSEEQKRRENYGLDYQKGIMEKSQAEINDSVAAIAKLEENAKDRPLTEAEKRELEIAEKTLETNKAQLEEAKRQAAQLEKINAYTDLVEKSAKEVAKYQATFNSRLQGTEKNFEKISTTLERELTVSPFVSIPNMLAQIKSMTDQGIAYNLEERAFLGQISDRIADTFNVLDQSLTRLIRLQQADTTRYRLGLEATLTKFLNNMFMDTSYLSGVSDAVSAAILDANAQLTRDQSLSFEGTVQKWLGSLYSLGASQNVITQIATGLNMLGTGDVKGLAGNTAMQNILAMSASRAGLNYGALLTGGLTGEDTNKLLKSMVSYLRDIANNSSNQVVKKAFADVFSVTISDMRAMQSLTDEDIDAIAGKIITKSSLESEFTNQLLFNVPTRTPVSQLIDTVFENINYTKGANIAQNPIFYGSWRAVDYLRRSLGGGAELGDIAIPGVSIFGNMVDLHTGIFQLIQAGMMGLSDMITLIKGIESLANLGGLSMAHWGGKEYTPRGKGYTGVLAGAATGISQSGTLYQTTSSSGDIESSTLAGGAEKAKESDEIVGAGTKPEKTIVDVYNDTIGDEGTKFVRSYDTGLNMFATAFLQPIIERDKYIKVKDSDSHSLIKDIKTLLNKITTNGDNPTMKVKVTELPSNMYDGLAGKLGISTVTGSAPSKDAGKQEDEENFVKQILELLRDGGAQVQITPISSVKSSSAPDGFTGSVAITGFRGYTM